MNNSMSMNMNNGMGNNGLYVPQSGGTSIASIIQSKQQGGMTGNNSSNGSSNGSPNGSSAIGPLGAGMGGQGMARNVNRDVNRDAAYFGYGVDENGYPIQPSSNPGLTNNGQGD